MASAYLKWKYRDVQPDAPAEQTRGQRWRNWWYYHKWHVLIGAALLLIGADWTYHALSQVHPDYQLAYVGSVPLEGDGASWETQLAALGTDCDGDGETTVQVQQYLVLPDSEDPMYTYASNVKLMADLEARESYFFLLEDPERFQESYGVLQEDWFQVEDGLYLARRAFWEDRTAAHMEACDRLWERLRKEMA